MMGHIEAAVLSHWLETWCVCVHVCMYVFTSLAKKKGRNEAWRWCWPSSSFFEGVGGEKSLVGAREGGMDGRRRQGGKHTHMGSLICTGPLPKLFFLSDSVLNEKKTGRKSSNITKL